MQPTLPFTLNLRAAVYPAEDMPGMWIAHSLDWDVIGHGPTHGEALEMMTQALFETMAFRVSHHLPLIELSPAPPEIWELAIASGMPPSEARPLSDTEAVQYIETPEKATTPLRSFVSPKPPVHAVAG